MENSTEDRRVRKTKKLLRQGLAELLKTKPIKDISVRELSDLVDINRGTFYLHYRDIYDMLNKIENEMFLEFIALLKGVELGKENLMQVLTVIFDYLASNAELCGALLGPNGDIDFVNRMKSTIHEAWLYGWKQRQGDSDHLELRYSFLISGCVGVIETWLSLGMKESPQEIAFLIRSVGNGCF